MSDHVDTEQIERNVDSMFGDEITEQFAVESEATAGQRNEDDDFSPVKQFEVSEKTRSQANSHHLI